MKLGIVGAGFAGEIIAYTAAMKGLCEEISFVDINEKKAISQAMDINDARFYYPNDVKASSCSYQSLNDCDIIVLTSGGIPETSDRLDELKTNQKVVSQYTKTIVDSGFKGIFIVVSNPCDIMAYLVKKVSGFDSSRVIGAGTALDSSRVKSLISQITEISPKSIQAIVMGEHGESQFIPWSQVKIAGLNFKNYKNKYKNQFKNFNEDDFEDQVRKRGWEIYLGKSSTQYGIANTINTIISAIVHDENKVINVSAMLNGQYGLDDLYISTPCLINKNGIAKIFELPLESDELKKLNKAAELIKSYNEALL